MAHLWAHSAGAQASPRLNEHRTDLDRSAFKNGLNEGYLSVNVDSKDVSSDVGLVWPLRKSAFKPGSVPRGLAN